MFAEGRGGGEPVLLALEGLRVGYRGQALLPAIDLEIRAGEVWALIGANGSGKTTLMKTILGLMPAVGGRARWGGSGVKVGYVPQRSSFASNVPARVVDVVRGGACRGWSFLNPLPDRARAEAVERAMRDAGVEELAGQQFGRLSEGQKQRALMARALASNPAIMALDEPTSAMDMASERAVFELIDALRRRRALGVLLVSHHLSVTVAFATHGLLLDQEVGLVMAGDIQSVAASEACQARYGRLLLESIAARGGRGG